MEPGFGVGGWQVQPDVGTVSREERTVHLEPKVMDVLVYFAKHANELLPKEKIIQAVWPDTFVTDEVLTNAISELRKAFQDDAKNPKFIQTLPRRGYRLIAEVSPLQKTATDGSTGFERVSTEPVEPATTTRTALLILAVTLAIAVVLIWFWYLSPPTSEPIDSIAVLPFENEGEDEESEYLSEGIAQSIAFRLTNIAGLRVISSDRLRRYRGQEVDAQRVAGELGVRAVLAGSLMKVGEVLSLKVRLVDEQGTLLWGQPYSQGFAEVMTMETEIAGKVADSLRLRLTGQDRLRFGQSYARNPKAYESYLKGRYQRPTIDGCQLAILYLREAVRQDSEFGLAYVAMADFQMSLGFYLTSEEYFRNAEESAYRALQIDDTLAEAHRVMGEIQAFSHRRWEAADQEFNRARELNPNYEDPLYRYPLYLLWMGRRYEAIGEIERLSGRSDPLSVDQQNLLASRFYYARDYDRALQYMKRAGADQWTSFLAYQAQGMDEEAFEVARKNNFMRNAPGAEIDEYGQAFAAPGMKGFWRVWLDRRNGRDKPYDLAGAYACVGESDLAFEWLEKVCESTIILPFVVDARFDSLRDDPRFGQLLRRQKLPEEVIAIHLAR